MADQALVIHPKLPMRDKLFIAEHRDGLLKKEQHIQLIIWACKCAEHVLDLSGETSDERLKKAFIIAREWTNGNDHERKSL